MAVPTRIFVGVTVFGLICSIITLAAFILLFACNAPPPETPLDLQQRACQSFPGGQKLFVGIACLFSIVFTALAWRTLLAGARHDRDRRQRKGSATPPVEAVATPEGTGGAAGKASQKGAPGTEAGREFGAAAEEMPPGYQ